MHTHTHNTYAHFRHQAEEGLKAKLGNESQGKIRPESVVKFIQNTPVCKIVVLLEGVLITEPRVVRRVCMYVCAYT